MCCEVYSVILVERVLGPMGSWSPDGNVKQVAVVRACLQKQWLLVW